MPDSLFTEKIDTTQIGVYIQIIVFLVVEIVRLRARRGAVRTFTSIGGLFGPDEKGDEVVFQGSFLLRLDEDK